MCTVQLLVHNPVRSDADQSGFRLLLTGNRKTIIDSRLFGITAPTTQRVSACASLTVGIAYIKGDWARSTARTRADSAYLGLLSAPSTSMYRHAVIAFGSQTPFSSRDAATVTPSCDTLVTCLNLWLSSHIDVCAVSLSLCSAYFPQISHQKHLPASVKSRLLSILATSICATRWMAGKRGSAARAHDSAAPPLRVDAVDCKSHT